MTTEYKLFSIRINTYCDSPFYLKRLTFIIAWIFVYISVPLGEIFIVYFDFILPDIGINCFIYSNYIDQE